MTRNNKHVILGENNRSNVHERGDEETTMEIMISTVQEDVRDIEAFYSVKYSAQRCDRLRAYFIGKLKELHALSFDKIADTEARTDYVLLEKYLQGQLKALENFNEQRLKMKPILEPFASALVDLINRRQAVAPTPGEFAAGVLSEACKQLKAKENSIKDNTILLNDKEKHFIAYGAVNALEDLSKQLTEWFRFYDGYDPLFSFWISSPYKLICQRLAEFTDVVREKLVGIKPGDDDAIIGQPVGRQGILAELESAVIPYTPEELIDIAERQYAWCEKHMIAASKELGYGDRWRDALEHVKGMYPPIGQQPRVAHELAEEAISYVKKHNLVTVPEVAEETWRTHMMPPDMQKAAPFFLGGESILVAYPTAEMGHEEKLMSLRANSRPFSRAVVFHELIPGHNLQYHMIRRYRKYRNLFTTPFWMEGWAVYWEMILWDHGFVDTPENRIGALFWRMHRCIRIIFSLGFHIGTFTVDECIDMLVKRVGHERLTAEGEVRRSFNGDWSPLYQAGYMLGALQLYSLRQEMVENGEWTERQFHDRVLREGQMSIEVLRALLTRKHTLKPGYKASWRFADKP